MSCLCRGIVMSILSPHNDQVTMAYQFTHFGKYRHGILSFIIEGCSQWCQMQQALSRVLDAAIRARRNLSLVKSYSKLALHLRFASTACLRLRHGSCKVRLPSSAFAYLKSACHINHGKLTSILSCKLSDGKDKPWVICPSTVEKILSYRSFNPLTF